MSEIKVDKISGKTSVNAVTVTGENGSTTTNLQQGLAKAWINFNGTGTIASRDTFNITSLADVATGKYSFNIINDMNNNDYAISGGGRTPSATSGDINAPSDADSDQATGSLEFYSIQGSSGNATDLSHVYVIIHGDLA
tara:strand:- start:39 stop:455 length:417 start_codon:yes stop_codon:yes gene_type:complete